MWPELSPTPPDTASLHPELAPPPDVCVCVCVGEMQDFEFCHLEVQTLSVFCFEKGFGRAKFTTVGKESLTDKLERGTNKTRLCLDNRNSRCMKSHNFYHSSDHHYVSLCCLQRLLHARCTNTTINSPPCLEITALLRPSARICLFYIHKS